MPTLAIGFAGLVLLPAAMLVPFRTKLVVRHYGVAAYRQPFYSNPSILIAAMSAILSGGMLGGILQGDDDAWRLFVPAVLLAGLVPFLLIVDYRYRGPLILRWDGIELGNRTRLQFDSTTIGFVELDRGAPAIEFTSATQRRSRRLGSRIYNLDFNTLMSTVEQLQAWHALRRPTTPAEIEAMLTVTPPDVAVGESVELTVSVGGQDGQQ